MSTGTDTSKTATSDFASYRKDAVPDRIDMRDWMYQPTLAPLPRTLVSCHGVPEILDQKREGACTGFALAAVINFLLHQRKDKRRVSPRMLYEMARRYDEWPGERYVGSSARGAMKGWVRHGVASRDSWPDGSHGASRLDSAMAEDALKTPGGAYYRVAHRQIREVHAALFEVGTVFCTLMVHSGWDSPAGKSVEIVDEQSGKSITLPVILRKGRADGGHAVALVGYGPKGFIVQNSWGDSWGAKGFALLPYEDFMLHATDVWVAQLGVPVATDVWLDDQRDDPDALRGLHRSDRALPLAALRPFIVNVGNNGKLSDSGNYWTTREDLQRLVNVHVSNMREKKQWDKPRVMLYLHGGLNSEKCGADRAGAMFGKMLANGIYPVFVLWETGFQEVLKDCFDDWIENAQALAGRSVMGYLSDGRDFVIERSLAAPLGGVWREIKENARLASEEGGAMRILADLLKSRTINDDWELHVVAHSAGSIFFAYLLPLIVNHGLPLRSVQFMAPAITVDLFKKNVAPNLKEYPVMYALNQDAELADTVGGELVYGKSLLYLVSNACEDERGMPLLGMDRFVQGDEALRGKFGSGNYILSGQPGCSSTSHGAFDNDVATMNSVLQRMLGRTPPAPFTESDLRY